MPCLRSSAVAPLPTQTKMSESLSTTKTSLESSISFFSWPRATSVVFTEPVVSDTLMSLMSPREALAGTSSGTAGAIGPWPPNASQNSGLSPPCSNATNLALPPRSSSLMPIATSRALDFSLRLASEPFHCMMVGPVSSRKTSPAFRDFTDRSTCLMRTERVPFRCSSRVSYASRSTCLKPEPLPPLRYSIDLKHCRNSCDSLPCSSRCCTGAPPSASSISTALYAATPCSSAVDSAPSQKKRSHTSLFLG
mmetsp:Transcript_2735/g.9238  ORF Transcript_2735/g.9238 Transcript_2735/m.9238 type:complete len:251 (+) Transcript_2735:1901-2653(+)